MQVYSQHNQEARHGFRDLSLCLPVSLYTFPDITETQHNQITQYLNHTTLFIAFGPVLQYTDM